MQRAPSSSATATPNQRTVSLGGAIRWGARARLTTIHHSDATGSMTASFNVIEGTVGPPTTGTTRAAGMQPPIRPSTLALRRRRGSRLGPLPHPLRSLDGDDTTRGDPGAHHLRLGGRGPRPRRQEDDRHDHDGRQWHHHDHGPVQRPDASSTGSGPSLTIDPGHVLERRHQGQSDGVWLTANAEGGVIGATATRTSRRWCPTGARCRSRAATPSPTTCRRSTVVGTSAPASPSSRARSGRRRQEATRAVGTRRPMPPSRARPRRRRSLRRLLFIKFGTGNTDQASVKIAFVPAPTPSTSTPTTTAAVAFTLVERRLDGDADTRRQHRSDDEQRHAGVHRLGSGHIVHAHGWTAPARSRISRDHRLLPATRAGGEGRPGRAEILQRRLSIDGFVASGARCTVRNSGWRPGRRSRSGRKGGPGDQEAPR